MSASLTTFCRATATILVAQCVLTLSAAGDSPYSEIAKRNAFGLLPPPPPKSDKPEKEPEPPPNVKVTGITTIMGIPRALVKVQFPAKPQQPAHDESYILVAGGAAQGGVEVLEIQDSPDPKDVKVKVRQDGKEFWLSLEKDTTKAAVAAKGKPGAKPAQVAAARAAAQRLAAARAAAGARAAAARAQPGNPAPIPNSNVLPTRTIRSAQGQGASASGLLINQAANGTSRSYTPPRQESPQRTREEAELLLEMNRERFQAEVDSGKMPPLPPPSPEMQSALEGGGPDQ